MHILWDILNKKLININLKLLILNIKIRIYRVHKNGTGPYENKVISLRYPWDLEYFDHYLPDGSERN